MNSPNDATTNPSPNLREQLERIGLTAVAAQLDDMLAHAARQRWSPRQLLEQLAQIEVAERAHRSLERRLRAAEIKKLKPIADFDWSWPTRIERDVIERALTLDFLAEARNLVLVGANGLGKTMIAQNICHAAVLAGHSALTTNKPFKEWNEVFPNAACIATMLDRLLHHAEVTVIEGSSYRVRESEQEATARRRRKK